MSEGNTGLWKKFDITRLLDSKNVCLSFRGTPISNSSFCQTFKNVDIGTLY
jgi:hypothetical protein